MFQHNDLVFEINKLQKFALRLTKNTHNAEDLLQSTLLRALERSYQFQRGTNLFKWTSKIMFHLFASGYRKKKKFETQYDPAAYIDQLSVEPSQEYHIDLVTTNKCIDRLTSNHQEILTLVCINQMCYEEVSKVLKIPLGTVRSRLSRARDQLQKVMTPSQKLTFHTKEGKSLQHH